MPWLFELVLAVHVGAGIVALTSFWAAVATRKGGASHRRWGTVFAAAIYAAGACALAMGSLSLVWPLAMHPGLTDADLYRGLFGWMMLYLAVLTMSMTRYGLTMIVNRRDHAANRHWSMVALQLLVLAAAINCAWHGVRLHQPLMIGVSIIGFGTTLTYLWYMFQPNPDRRAYIPEHLKAMVATGIAAYTAFLSVGLVEMFPAHAFNPAIWAVPTVIGVAIIAWFLRGLTRRSPIATERPAPRMTPSALSESVKQGLQSPN